jgi:hypothetical protein
LVVILTLAGLALARAAADAKRAVARVSAYSDLPLFAAIRKAQGDLARLEAASREADRLAFRAAVAIESIRRGLAVFSLLRPR